MVFGPTELGASVCQASELVCSHSIVRAKLAQICYKSVLYGLLGCNPDFLIKIVHGGCLDVYIIHLLEQVLPKTRVEPVSVGIEGIS